MEITNAKQKIINLIIVGIGPHAKRAYIPYLLNLREKYAVEIVGIIELKEMEVTTRDYFQSISLSPKQIYIDRFDKDKLPKAIESMLDDFIKGLSITSVIISTEPQVHKAFAFWAIKNSLHVLMDKPISTRANVITSEVEAKKIYTDYQDLLHLYKKQQSKKKIVFSIHVQRRYHTGFHKVFELIRDVADKTGCPITSIQSMHADGQWRLPSELIDLKYHGYNLGYGKVSHSGYHFFDLVYQLLRSSYIKEKWPENVDVYSSFLLSAGLLSQIKEKDFEKFFGDQYKKSQKYSRKQLSKLTQGFGEIDAYTLVDFKKHNITVCHVSINLIHNSFSRRSWMHPDKDLYKGNGRVKHESHVIQQGPFQSIYIHSYQAKDKHDKNSSEDYDFGGNNHFDIHVFRNIEILGGDKPYTYIRIDEILKEKYKNKPGLVIEQIKESVVKEFLNAIRGKIKKSQLISSIEDHDFATHLMSAVYVSHVRRTNGELPVVSFKIGE